MELVLIKANPRRHLRLYTCDHYAELTSQHMVPKGTAFGGFKSRRDVPQLVQQCIEGKLPIDHFITHRFDGVDCTNDAIDALHGGDCLRAVVRY